MTMSALKPTNELFEGQLAAAVRPIHNTATTNIPGRTTGSENLVALVILRPFPSLPCQYIRVRSVR